MYIEARGVPGSSRGSSRGRDISGTSDLHRDLLQVPWRASDCYCLILFPPQSLGQQDLSVADTRRNKVKKMLSPCMRDRLKDKEADLDKLRHTSKHSRDSVSPICRIF